MHSCRRASNTTNDGGRIAEARSGQYKNHVHESLVSRAIRPVALGKRPRAAVVGARQDDRVDRGDLRALRADRCGRGLCRRSLVRRGWRRALRRRERPPRIVGRRDRMVIGDDASSDRVSCRRGRLRVAKRRLHVRPRRSPGRLLRCTRSDDDRAASREAGRCRNDRPNADASVWRIFRTGHRRRSPFTAAHESSTRERRSGSSGVDRSGPTFDAPRDPRRIGSS